VSQSPYTLGFSNRHFYTTSNSIVVPVSLTSDRSRSIEVVASLDTGSTCCIFERECATLLGLQLTSGVETRVATATGYFYCYGHELTLSVFDLEWQAVVYFAEMEAFALNVVGRAGFLDRLQIGIVDYEQLLYLGLYNQF
jgi:hypothetical protein